MNDAHYHRSGWTFASHGGKEYRFAGVHPWDAEGVDIAKETAGLRSLLEADPSLGVGEIGLDRLKTGKVSDAQRGVFAAQLALAADAGRRVVLHGTKCWGEVVKAVKPYAGRIPAFLFHGFSRSGGLIPEIVALNGFISVGKAVLNAHAVNYRELVKAVPVDRILVETDSDGSADGGRSALREEISAEVSRLAGVGDEVFASNLAAFLGKSAESGVRPFAQAEKVRPHEKECLHWNM